MVKKKKKVKPIWQHIKASLLSELVKFFIQLGNMWAESNTSDTKA